MKESLLAITVGLLCWCADASTVIATTQFGNVTGTSSTSGIVWYNIPYAQAPTGSLRWKATVPWNSTYSGGQITGTSLNNVMCMQSSSRKRQPSSGTLSEDCLFLHVFAPAGASVTDSRPVLFWIHGGGFTGGSGNQYSGLSLATTTGSLVVTINYRLGLFGYFALPELVDESGGMTGNYGLLDQVEALKWVHNNIAAFGGDKSRVMVFGQSAGGASTIALYSMASNKGLFAAAAAESPPYEPHWLEDVYGLSTKTATAAGCTGSGSTRLKCLRNLTASSLIAVDPGSSKGAWGVTIDGVTLVKEQWKLIRDGNFTRVPLLIGTNSNEDGNTVFSTITFEVNASYYPTAIYTVEPRVNSTLRDDILEVYPATSYDNRYNLANMTNDLNWTCVNRRIMRQASKYVSVFGYKFYGNPTSSGAGGSTHGAEVDFIWSSVSGWTNLSTIMKFYWNSMAENGNPNTNSTTGSLYWPVFNSTTNGTMIALDSILYTIDGYRNTYCDLWDKVIWPHLTQDDDSSSVAAVENASVESSAAPAATASSGPVVESSLIADKISSAINAGVSSHADVVASESVQAKGVSSYAESSLSKVDSSDAQESSQEDSSSDTAQDVSSLLPTTASSSTDSKDTTPSSCSGVVPLATAAFATILLLF